MQWSKVLGTKTALKTFKKLAATAENLDELTEVLGSNLKQKVTKNALRKAWEQYGSGSLTDLLKTKEFVPDEAIQERLGNQEKNDLKKQNNALLSELAMTKQLLNKALEVKEYQLTPIKLQKVSSGTKQRTAVVLASDWHVEETVLPETVNGRNEYNLAVAERRINLFFQNVRGLIEGHRKGGSQIDTLVLWLGGDLMTGFIHEELMESNGLSPTETVLFLLRHLSAHIRELSKFINLRVPCSFGNHGRTTPKRRIATGSKNSYEWLLYHILAQSLGDLKNVEFKIADGDHVYIDVYGYTIRFTHGDNFKSNGGVGGLSVPVLKGVARLESFYHADYTCMGHFHTFSDLGNVVVNGSMIGYSNYAVSINAPFEEPKQMFFLIDPEHGKCQVTPVWLS